MFEVYKTRTTLEVHIFNLSLNVIDLSERTQNPLWIEF